MKGLACETTGQWRGFTESGRGTQNYSFGKCHRIDCLNCVEREREREREGGGGGGRGRGAGEEESMPKLS